MLRIFLRLGLTSFGGPVAHLGYFRAEFVERRRWLDEHAFADIVALCQFLPGPASSQVGMSIGILRAGLPGAFAAWLGFTMPSAVAMILFGYGVTPVRRSVGRRLAARPQDRRRRGRRAGGVGDGAQPVPRQGARHRRGRRGDPGACGAVGGGPGRRDRRRRVDRLGRAVEHAPARPSAPLAVHLPRSWSIAAVILFFGLLIGLPLVAAALPVQPIRLFDSFYRSGALVFGGGHVVLPLLQAAVVPPGWVSNDVFLAGYGAAQAVPGPLFTFSAYLGTVSGLAPNGWVGGLLCLVAIFLPSFLLLVGALPYWDSLRRLPAVQSGLRGVNAAVVGLLLAALYHPVWTSAIHAPADFAIGIVAFLLLALWSVPPWLVVILGALGASLVRLAGVV